MDTINKYLGIMFGLIVLYIIVYKASESNQVIRSLSEANVSAIKALQGR